MTISVPPSFLFHKKTRITRKHCSSATTHTVPISKFCEILNPLKYLLEKNSAFSSHPKGNFIQPRLFIEVQVTTNFYKKTNHNHFQCCIDLSSGPSSNKLPHLPRLRSLSSSESSGTLTFRFTANCDSQEFSHKALQELYLNHKQYFIFIFQTKSYRPVIHSVKKCHLSLHISKGKNLSPTCKFLLIGYLSLSNRNILHHHHIFQRTAAISAITMEYSFQQ